MFLLDVNLLMALLWESHEHYDIARTWFRTVNEFATCPVVQLGFARVSSHPALGYGLLPDDAFAVLRRLLADSRHRFIPDDLSCEDRVVRTDWISSTKQVTDHYLVALARQHRVTLATFDEPLATRFAGEEGLVHLIRPR
jgi:toxin-antitoxin system PIN domain toxin